MGRRMQNSRFRPRFPSAVCAVVLGLASSAPGWAQSATQAGDSDWVPTVAQPAFERDSGPVVLVDAAHGNFHTIDARFGAFAELLRSDGYRVESSEQPVTPERLRKARVFVVSNAIAGGADAEWRLPIPPAFTAEEVDTIASWVGEGGSLLLIADHMPFPGATENLAQAFGIVFLNGFAMRPGGEGGVLTFSRATGSLADHPITRGRAEAERVQSIASFTGQAFRFVAPGEPLMRMPDDWEVLLPVDAWEFDASTPRVSARGLVQGGALRFGAGRVAVFGEAAMFTAQSVVRDGVVARFGMNHPAATENAQFVLNVLHWLTGLLDEAP